MNCLFPLLALASLISTACAAAHAEPDTTPYFATLEPKPEQPGFAVCSRQGMRILLSRDDRETWRQVFRGKTWTPHPHGLAGKPSWRGLSFVHGEFWLTDKDGTSSDGWPSRGRNQSTCASAANELEP